MAVNMNSHDAMRAHRKQEQKREARQVEEWTVNFIKAQQPIEPEIVKAVDEHFWELV